MLLRERFGAYHKKNTQHINTLWQNMAFLNGTLGGIYGCHWHLNGW